MTHSDARVCLGAFAGAHGVRGDVLIKAFTQAPGDVVAYGPVETEDGSATFTLAFVRDAKPGFIVARAREITSREDALALKGERFYVHREALPATGDEDEYYVEDLVGLEAMDEAGNPAGHVSAVHNFGAGDLVELKDIPGVRGARIIAFTRANIPEIDIDAARIKVARAALEDADQGPSISDETGEIVSDDLDLDRDAIRQEDA